MIWAQILIVIIVKNPRIKPLQSMVFNAKLVALDNLQSAAIPQPSEPNENKGERMLALGPILMRLTCLAVNMQF